MIGAEISSKSGINQVISTTTLHIDMYSTSVEIGEIEACFLDFQEIGEDPRET